MPESQDLSALLAASRSAHQQAKQARQDGRIDAHLTAVALAARHRLAAHTADPGHADPAWTEDRAKGFVHDLLMVFYADELSKDHSRVKAIASQRVIKAQAVVAQSLTRV